MNPFEEMLYQWLTGVSLFWIFAALVGAWYWYRLKKNEPEIVE